jgi:hypothetical protein
MIMAKDRASVPRGFARVVTAHVIGPAPVVWIGAVYDTPTTPPGTDTVVIAGGPASTLTVLSDVFAT